jgi:hypothetical protein
MGPDLGGPWGIDSLGYRVVKRLLLWDVYFLFSIEEELYNLDTGQVIE